MSIDFSRRVTEGSRSPLLQTLGNQLIDHSYTLGMLTTNITYCVILLEYINESQVNACVAYMYM